MAHELTFVNGRAQMFAVGDPSWHGLEQRPDRAVSYEAALRDYGLDYDLVKLPWYRPVVVHGSSGVPAGRTWEESADAFYVQRPDTGAVLGTVGKPYELVLNRDAFAPMRPLVDEGVVTLETGGVLRQGADAWLLGRWDLSRLGPEAREVLGEEVLPFSAVLANHSGRRGIVMGNTPIRVVCANTLGMAETDGSSRWQTVTHAWGAKAKLAEVAAQVFANVVERYESIARSYRLLKATALSQQAFAELVLDCVAPDPRRDRRFNPESKMAGMVLERADAKRAKLTALWTGGRGHTGEPTAWFAYNAAVEAVDHCSDLWPNRDGSWRSRGLLGSQWTEVKGRVLDNLVAHCGAACAA